MTSRCKGIQGNRFARTLMASALVVCAFVPVGLSAQAVCAHDVSATAPGHWTSPLDRTVTLAVRDVSLRDGLDRVAAAARLRLSYSSDLLPLDRAVCLPDEPMAAGDALAQLLRGTSVQPVVAGADQVVLAPMRPETADSQVVVSPKVSVLDRVVVTGSAVGASERGLAVALDVLDGRQLEQRGAGTMSHALDQSLPGIWVWEQSPSSLVARYGSIRGASSFGLSYPKVYVDGIEVANPLLMTQLSPEAVDHVEVIRGPQGAALYGADAISGVVNVVSRHEGADGAAARAEIRSDAGLSLSDFANRPALVQDHSLLIRGGSNLRSADLAATFGSIGEFMPAASSHEVRSTLAVRLIGSRSTLTGTARFYDKEAGVPANPLLDSALSRTDSLPQTVRQYTIGGTGTFLQSGRWTHSLTAGIDGYRLSNVPNDDAPVPSAVDSALSAARGGADRATVRMSSVARLEGSRAAATLTFAAEQSTLRETVLSGDAVMGMRADPDAGQRQMGTGAAMGGTASGAAPTNIELWRHSTGVSAQADASWRDALYLTSGLRIERDDGIPGAGGQTSALPMIGGAAVRDVGPLTAKIRTAYGRAIRPPETSARELMWLGMRRSTGAPALRPEEQSGVEGGVDLLYGNSLGVHVTRFDQRAFGLIQPVSILADTLTTASGAAGRRLLYQLQNVGEISNRGWELQGTAGVGRLSASAALTLVDSRVVTLAEGYSGDLRAGDRMLGVPARTASVTARWLSRDWYATWTVTRVSDWTNYDRLQIARAWAAVQGTPTGADDYFVGDQLRAFWMQYPAVTRLGASFSHNLPFGFSLLLSGQNLLNQQRGEPDNLTIVPGRTFLAGLRAAF